MILTPGEFSKQISKWYEIWRNSNPNYFPLEARLTQKAHTVGYLEMDDLIAITRVLGNSYNRRGKVRRSNTNEDIKEKTGAAIRNLANPANAFLNVRCIREWGLTYATKTLRCVCPRNYSALDSKLHKGIDRKYFPSRDETKRYLEFLSFCEQIRKMVTEPGPREGGEWFIGDVEIALFQFVWDENNRII